MLKPQPRSSPVATSLSPTLHTYRYGQSSPRTINLAPSRTSSLSQRSQYSPKLAPPRQAVHYADHATQWSPPIVPKMESLVLAVPPVPLQNSSPTAHEIPQPDIPKPHASAAIPTSAPADAPARPVKEGESPSSRKREPPEESASGASSIQGQVLPERNVRPRPAQGPVKILPLRYEFCDVKDIVDIIADMISALIQTNDVLPLRQGILTRFHSR